MVIRKNNTWFFAVHWFYAAILVLDLMRNLKKAGRGLQNTDTGAIK